MLLPCDFCDETGYDFMEFKVCVECLGEGVLEEITCYLCDGVGCPFCEEEGKLYNITCPECDGSGQVPKRCPECRGRKEVLPPIDEKGFLLSD